MATQARALAAFPPTLRRQPRSVSRLATPRRKRSTPSRWKRARPSASPPRPRRSTRCGGGLKDSGVLQRRSVAYAANCLLCARSFRQQAACADSKAKKTAYLLAKDAVPVLRKAAAELKGVAAKLKVEAKEINLVRDAAPSEELDLKTRAHWKTLLYHRASSLPHLLRRRPRRWRPSWRSAPRRRRRKRRTRRRTAQCPITPT